MVIIKSNIDISPLENYHTAETFKVLLKPENNILKFLDQARYRLVRKRMIECIISTDMTHHSKLYSSLKNKLSAFEINDGNNVEKMIVDSANSSNTFDNQQLVLNNILHLADISNPAKPSKIYSKWVDLVFVEFFNQGDLEKKQNLPISLLCDRETTNINKAQIGFIKFVVKPLMECVLCIIPEINPYMETMKHNLKTYEKLAEEKK